LAPVVAVLFISLSDAQEEAHAVIVGVCSRKRPALACRFNFVALANDLAMSDVMLRSSALSSLMA